jgi:large subunit ribosomal protein L24
MRLHKGDTVEVLSGTYRGKRGTVMRVLPKEDRVIVEGINVAKKHQRQTKARVKGGIIDKDMPVPASLVALVCPKDGAVRVGLETKDDGTKVRACKRCGREL